METQKLLAVLCCILFPPLGVIIGGGTIVDLIINIVLTVAFWFPGFLHSLYVVLK